MEFSYAFVLWRDICEVFNQKAIQYKGKKIDKISVAISVENAGAW